MFKTTTATRIAIGLTSITMSVLLGAYALGLIPDSTRLRLEGRSQLCDVIAVQLSVAAHNKQFSGMEDTIQSIVERNHDMLSISVQVADHSVLFQTKNHESNWISAPDKNSTPTHVRIPIFNGKQKSGEIQICFKPVRDAGLAGALGLPSFRLVIFVALLTFIAFLIYLHHVLRSLDPSSIISGRVKDMLDTMAEGVLVLDQDERIMLANKTFQKITGQSVAELQGHNASDLPWKEVHTGEDVTEYPWNKSNIDGAIQKRLPLTLKDATGAERTFIVNSMPIMGANGERRGVLATFDDVTATEKGNTQLEARNPQHASHLPATALRIGLDIERLATALDAQDMAQLSEMAKHLSMIATQLDLSEIATMASQIKNECDSDYDLEEVLTRTRELLELCHSANQDMARRVEHTTHP